MIASLLTKPCTVLEATEPSDDYDQTPGEPVETETVCYLEQTRADEDVEGSVSVTTWDVYLPADLELDAAAQVDVDGRRYQFVGDPEPVWNPRTRATSHWRGTLRRADG